MAGPTSPSAEGPTFAPPQTPPGWIAQWDGASRKYYFVQLSTGLSQWDVPTQTSDTSTPGVVAPYPYGLPPHEPEIITHADGSKTVKHADGRMQPILSREDSERVGVDVDGQTADRGIGSFAVNALLGSGKHSSGSSLGNIAGGLVHALGHAPGSGGSSSHSKPPPSPLGKLGALANLMGGAGHGGGGNSSSSSKPPGSPLAGGSGGHAANNNSSSGSHSSGLNSVLSGVGSFLHKPNVGSHNQGQGYGYSNSGQHDAQYNSAALPPAASYQQHQQQQQQSQQHVQPDALPPQGAAASYYQSPAPHNQPTYGQQAPTAYQPAPVLGQYGSFMPYGQPQQQQQQQQQHSAYPMPAAPQQQQYMPPPQQQYMPPPQQQGAYGSSYGSSYR